jgi:hypothetical protein
MRIRGLTVASIVSFAIIALSKRAIAESQNCLLGAGIDNVLISAQGGCEWGVTKGVSFGAMGVFHHRIASEFDPNLGVDLTLTGVVEKWVAETAIGGGFHWLRPNTAGFADASAFFTGTMATAPYVESYIFFYPRFFGEINGDAIIFRQRLGLKVKMGRSNGEVVAGAQTYFPDLSYQSSTVQTGEFVELRYKF